MNTVEFPASQKPAEQTDDPLHGTDQRPAPLMSIQLNRTGTVYLLQQ